MNSIKWAGMMKLVCLHHMFLHNQIADIFASTVTRRTCGEFFTIKSCYLKSKIYLHIYIHQNLPKEL